MKSIKKHKVMVVDDSKTNIDILVDLLGAEYDIRVARDGVTALEIMRDDPPALVLLDIMMPDVDGLEVCRRMQTDPLLQNVDVIFVTAMVDSFDEQQGLEAGAVDYITKPIKPGIVKLRIRNHLELKMARAQLVAHNHHLEEKVRERTREVLHTQNITIECLASLAETRDPETGNHIQRTKRYVQVLLERLMEKNPSYCKCSQEEARLIVKSAPLHDIGKVGIPDHILLKPGRLTATEFAVIRRHTTYGWQALQVAQKRAEANTFLQVAANMAYSHHEKWDGTGYPRRLQGEDIPLCGRLMAIADVYDALISRRTYKEPFSHEKAVEIIRQGDGRTEPEHFDPEIRAVFMANHEIFHQISQRHAENE
jgi:putative two-component system response regulator